jgi:hypothetical protein
MPAATLPLFTDDMTAINPNVAFRKKDGMVYYFNGFLPFYQHREGDRSGFKHVICQMLSNHLVTRAELSRAFKIPPRGIGRWLATFKEGGEGSFFVKKK